MSRWTHYLWQALAALAAAEYPYGQPYPAPDREVRPARDAGLDVADDATVRRIFREMVEVEWGNSTDTPQT